MDLTIEDLGSSSEGLIEVVVITGDTNSLRLRFLLGHDMYLPSPMTRNRHMKVGMVFVGFWTGTWDDS